MPPVPGRPSGAQIRDASGPPETEAAAMSASHLVKPAVASVVRQTPARGPAGTLMYVIGDVHGCADALQALLAQIREDEAASAHDKRAIIAFLGDYVDRGPASREAIDIILALRAEGRFGVGTLRGNHDQYLLDFLEDGRHGIGWLDYGGLATLTSYGVAPPRFRRDEAGWRTASEELGRRMPQEHKDFLAQTVLIAMFGDYVLAHAGVRPGVPLDEQAEEDLTGIRKAFYEHPDPAPGHTVIFGHTPFETPLVTGSVIGLDTGAYATGRLTALRIFEDQTRLMQTGPT
jgi:serine/threonine protein phosphatase 1